MKVLSDVDTGYWISRLQGRGSRIVSGYGDGSFHPNNTITRAEAFKMINGMLYRGPLNGAEPSYPDNLIDRWSFGQVEEATRSHISKFNADGSETMIEFIPEPLW